MAVSAADVKKLREKTDAPMMECKAALEEADGNFDKAEEILREKGKAAAAKRSDRHTSEGRAKMALSADGKKASGVIIECETDFVANSEPFLVMVDKILAGMLAAGQAGPDVNIDGQTVSEIITNAVAIIRENIQLKHSVFQHSHDGTIGIYNHHTGKLAAAVELTGPASNIAACAKELAIQVVAANPGYLKREDVPQDMIEREIKIETERAINEGKAPEMAANIAKGRVNKEFFQSQVLLEQPYYAEPKKSVSVWLAEEAKKGGGQLEAVNYLRLAVGTSQD